MVGSRVAKTRQANLGLLLGSSVVWLVGLAESEQEPQTEREMDPWTRDDGE